ncbi:MAG: oligoribonuclease [Candidatus Bipolaricaulaceae bacterium]
MTSRDRTNLVWMDLETTGLDPQTGTILEIATLVTDKDLNVLSKGPALVIHQPPEVLAGMDPWARRQHQASGLLQEVHASTVTLGQAEEETLAAVRRLCPPRACPLCGSSICLDRRFLLRHMPKLNAHLSYRHVNVTTVKELARRWFPDRVHRNGHQPRHRALADVLASLDELRFYRRSVFGGAAEG